ncbi:MAG: hypothetical protein J6Q38_00700 [Clostridia bacterium]|nr:hypothetical protein [Clostridia bacterium]
MVTNDYGKKAYVKVVELEKRIKKLENSSKESAYSELTFSFKDVIDKLRFAESFYVNALKDGNYSFTGSIDVVTGVEVSVFVNSIQVKNFVTTSSGVTSFTVEAPFNKGSNYIFVEVTSSQTFSLNLMNFKVCGNVSYVINQNSLSYLYYKNCDYVLHLNGSLAILYLYNTVSGLNFLTQFYGLKEASIIGVFNDSMYIIAITSKNALKIFKYTFLGNLETEIDLNVELVSSACGYQTDSGFKIYFSKLNEIYSGDYLPGSEFTYTNTGRKGVKLYCEPNFDKNVIIVDKYQNAKLVTD